MSMSMPMMNRDGRDIDPFVPVKPGMRGPPAINLEAMDPDAGVGADATTPVGGDALESMGVPVLGLEASDVYAGWADLVERIKTSGTEGMAELYELFSKGIRFYLCRQLGPQELDDKVHDTFVVVVQAIRRGELREPERLMGFVRTIVRRQVAAHIDRGVHDRRDQQDM